MDGQVDSGRFVFINRRMGGQNGEGAKKGYLQN